MLQCISILLAYSFIISKIIVTLKSVFFLIDTHVLFFICNYKLYILRVHATDSEHYSWIKSYRFHWYWKALKKKLIYVLWIFLHRWNLICSSLAAWFRFEFFVTGGRLCNKNGKIFLKHGLLIHKVTYSLQQYWYGTSI